MGVTQNMLTKLHVAVFCIIKSVTVTAVDDTGNDAGDYGNLISNSDMCTTCLLMNCMKPGDQLQNRVEELPKGLKESTVVIAAQKALIEDLERRLKVTSEEAKTCGSALAQKNTD